ncbi:MAG: transposase [Candidatus Methylophosphatis roskildensis]
MASFSLDAAVRVEADDRPGLERRLRYCARPAFALERLREIDPEHLVYESVKPGPGGGVTLMLTPLELLDRLAGLVRPRRAEQGSHSWGCGPGAGRGRPIGAWKRQLHPITVAAPVTALRGAPPRRHRHHTFGVLAPNAPLRAAVTALAGTAVQTPVVPAPARPPNPPSASAEAAEVPIHRRAARYAWALLLARIYEVFPLLCPKCGGELRIIAFVTEAVSVRQILAHLGEPTSPPRMAPARGPPLWEMTDAGHNPFDPQTQPAPDYEFDQRIAW